MCIIMSTNNMRHSNHINHNHNPHMHTCIRQPAANHPRSDAINSMQELQAIVNDASNNIQLSKDRCASAESSTCSRAEWKTSEPTIAPLIKPRNALLSDNHPRSPKLKTSGTCRDATNGTGRQYPAAAGANYRGDFNTNRRRSGSNEVICAHEVMKISVGVVVDDHAGACGGTKVLQVCCMCGDSGMAEFLFVCSKCSHRHQHIYCSRSYPNMGEEASICNWCLHAEEESTFSTSVTKAGDAVANKVATPIAGAEHRIGPLVSHAYIKDKACERRNHVLEDEDQVLVKKGHSKAFEYLLLVAAQSLRPQHNREVSDANVKIKQENHIKIETTSNRGSPDIVGKVNRKDPQIIKTNVTPLVNTVNVGPHVESKSNGGSPHINMLSMSLGTQQNMRIHSGSVKISIDHKNMDVGRFIRSGIPKRQRCVNKGFNAALKCKKKGLQLSPSKPNYRRYKLLADVVC